MTDGTALLDGLTGPSDLTDLTDDQLDALAEAIRLRIKQTVSANGGHLASNLGVVELTMALHRVFDFSRDRLAFDVGHQAYVHKLLTGRVDRFGTTRQAGGLSGFPDPKESPYDIAKVGHSSTAISTAVGVAEGFKLAKSDAKTVVMVGDGALTGGMAFEGLINAGDLDNDLLIVLNDNGSFIDPPVGSLHTYLDRIRTGRMYNSMRDRLIKVLKRMPGEVMSRIAEQAEHAAHKLVSPGYIFEDLGLRYFGPFDGHDRKLVERMLHRVRDMRGPVLLHVHTNKGGGWQPAEDDPLTYHGPRHFDVVTGEITRGPSTGRSYSQVFANTMLAQAAEDDRVVTVTAAMPTGTGLATFAKAYPDRMYDVGICEQHSFAFVQGLVLAGQLPVLAHYSTFAQRGFDQFFQEVIVQRDLGIPLVLDRAGLVGEDGETHQGLYDISWSRCMPGTVLLAPKDGIELTAMLDWIHRQRTDSATDGTTLPASWVIRYPKEQVPEYDWSQAPVELGKAEILNRGHGGIMVWAYGAMVRRAWDALREHLPAEAADRITLVNARFAKPIDVELLGELANDHHTMVTLEDHALPGGFGAAVSEAVADTGLSLRLIRRGVRDELVAHAPRPQQLIEQGLDEVGVAETLAELLDIDLAGINSPIPFTGA